MKLALLFLSLVTVSCTPSHHSGDSIRGNRPVTAPESNAFAAGYDPNAGEYSEEKMLANIGLNVLAPQVQELQTQSAHLESDVADLCAALAVARQDLSAAEAKVRKQWISTMLAYHKLPAFGPLQDRGRYLAQSLYAWPNFNACAVDLAVVKLKAGKKSVHMPVSIKGLGALEYLIFDEALDSNCNPQDAANKPAFDWVALGDSRSRRLDRCRFAEKLARDVHDSANQLATYWDPQGLNFSKTLIDGSRYASLHEATHGLSESLIGLATVKDPDLVEHPWSGIAQQALSARLEGFKAILLGSNTPNSKRFGLDDTLAATGRKDLAERLLSAANAAQVRGRPAYGQVRELTAILKSEFLPALSAVPE